MFEIHPVDADKAAQLAKLAGVDLPVLAMVLWVNGVEDGYVLYSIEKDTAQILCISCTDPALQEWLVRAALNAAANRYAITAVCECKELFPLLQRLGFTDEGDRLSVFIPDFFNRPCAGKCNTCG